MIDFGTAPNGKRIRREITAKSRNELVQKRRTAIADSAKRNWVSGRVPTVEQWATTWLNDVAAPRIRPGVRQNYASYIRLHIAPTIGARRLDKLTPNDIRSMHKAMDDRGLSPRTIQAVHNTLSKCLGDAVREELIFSNPCDRMDKPRAVSRQRGAFSRAEVKAILDTAKDDGAAAYSRWLAALMIGARQGELLGMEWDRVDLDAAMMDTSWQVQRIPWRHGDACGCGVDAPPRFCPAREPDCPASMEVRPCHGGVWFQRPKTAASIRLIPIPDQLLGALRAWREESIGEGLVWHDHGRPWEPRVDRARWKDLCQRAGVRGLDLHSARHTMVSLLLDSGVSPEVIRQIAGHSTVLSTRQYMHVDSQQAREALGRFPV